MKYEIVDDCPVPAKLAPVLRLIDDEIRADYQSIYRGTDARALLNAHGKHDQAWLYANLPRGVANPPGRSTHELRSDGVAYAGPIGRPLLWWQCGIDVDNAHVAAFIRAAEKHGWLAFRPYAAGVEYHHVNFRRMPVYARPLKKGSRGWAVRYLTFKLYKLGYLKKTAWAFGAHVEQAIKRFQRSRHLSPDGQVGAHTAQAITVARRRQKRHLGFTRGPYGAH